MSEELETVATFATPGEARFARNRLRNAGIDAILVGDDAGTGDEENAAGIALQVPAGDVLEARICLADIESDSEQITTTPHAFCRPPYQYDGEEDDEPPPTPRERNAERAFIGAAFGILFFPIQFYVAYLLLQVVFSNEAIRPRYQRRAAFAVVLNLPVMLLFCLMLRMMIMPID